MMPILLLLAAGSLYYASSGGESCARCHEIRATFNTWRMSSHRSVGCTSCHAGFQLDNLRRLITHLRGRMPEQLRIKNRDMGFLLERCQKCHQQEYADWQAGPHSVTYAQIFLDPAHNRKRPLADDCLRCHGMHFEGSVRDLVGARPAGRPAIPCLSCHELHREGQPLKKGAAPEIARPSLALFDRREMMHVSALPLPTMQEGGRTVKMSPDPRQGLCYQCHAPLATRQVGSGDDRTGIGVHEGIGCLACHQKHGLKTRASCANCHPRLSNCGLDVEKMDTTFVSPKSPHNIHFVKCRDCHPKGVPKGGQSP